MRPVRLVAIVLLLGLYLGVPAASASKGASAASPRHERTLHPGTLGFLDRLHEFLVSVWNKTGCAIDPLGRCSPDHTEAGPRPPATGPTGVLAADEGCAIDPWGRCSADHLNGWPTPPSTGQGGALDADTGCDIDPLGVCARGR